MGSSKPLVIETRVGSYDPTDGAEADLQHVETAIVGTDSFVAAKGRLSESPADAEEFLGNLPAVVDSAALRQEQRIADRIGEVIAEEDNRRYAKAERRMARRQRARKKEQA